MRLTVPFAGPGVGSRSVTVDPQKTVNLYPQVEGQGAKTNLTLYGTPGLSLVAAAGVGPHRSNIAQLGARGYFVSGGSLLNIDANDVLATLGSLNTVGGRCSIAAGRDHVMVVDGVNGYTYDGSTFAQIADADFPNGATHVTYLDGYFIVNTGSDDRFFISGLEDPTAWAALDFGTAESDPDNILALISNHRDLYLLGRQTTEVYFNSGNLDFPFEVYPNGVMEWGIMAPHSLARVQGQIFFLARTEGGGPLVVHVSGFQGRVISTWQLGDVMRGFSSLVDATGIAYEIGNNSFYELTFPAGNRTFVYHLEQNTWHELESYDIGRHRVATYGFFNNRHLAGDYTNGNLYELDYDTFTENGAVLRRSRRTQVFHRDRLRMQVHELEVEFEPGVGLTSGQGSDPQAMLRYSHDGGRTWSAELWRPIGKKGKYLNRSVWRQLGVARQFVFELAVSDPVKVAVVSGYLDLEVLNA